MLQLEVHNIPGLNDLRQLFKYIPNNEAASYYLGFSEIVMDAVQAYAKHGQKEKSNVYQGELSQCVMLSLVRMHK